MVRFLDGSKEGGPCHVQSRHDNQEQCPFRRSHHATECVRFFTIKFPASMVNRRNPTSRDVYRNTSCKTLLATIEKPTLSPANGISSRQGDRCNKDSEVPPEQVQEEPTKSDRSCQLSQWTSTTTTNRALSLTHHNLPNYQRSDKEEGTHCSFSK